MAGALRRMPNTSPSDGIYTASGSLEHLQPGRRLVRALTVTRLHGAPNGLGGLAALDQLHRLELERVADVDLDPLTACDLRVLSLDEVRNVDLAPLGRLRRLTTLNLNALRDCAVPETLPLPPSLQQLALGAFDAPEEIAQLKALVKVIDWSRLTDLKTLVLGAADPSASIELDLGLLRHLQRLRYLRLDSHIRHRGVAPSPLHPPFEGLPTGLRSIVMQARDPGPLRSALERRLPDAEISISAVMDDRPTVGDWVIDAPEEPGSEWTTYGSLYEAVDRLDPDHELATEHEALEVAIRRLHAADPGLLEHLEFDQEADSTGIAAPARGDLERALRILGLR